MRLPRDPRRWFELAARVAAIALVAWMIVRALAPAARVSIEERSDSRALSSALTAWTLAPVPTSVHVTFATAPRARELDWLRALAGAGVRVGWSGDSIPPTAVEVAARTDPAGGVRAFVAAPPGSHATLSDAVGLLDSVTVGAGVNALTVPMASGALDVAIGDQHARAGAPDSVLPRQVVVLGAAGWEGKFVVASLQERGWKVSSRLRVAPGIFASQGMPLALDTAHTGAVIALDSSAASYGVAITAFERSGGGVVLAGDAPLAPAFRAISAGRAGARVPAASISFASATPRRALGFYPVLSIASDAVALESRDGRIAAAARRVGAGRVVQLGYDETWRWRLAGTGDAPAAHRDYWSSVVAAAAYRATARTAATLEDAAPLASLHAALGDPTVAHGALAIVGARLPWWMFAALAVLLLAEWGSRRLRGAR
jgi:hypothetical protein